MRSESHKKEHYRSLANYYKNLTIMKRQKASVHLEAKDDELFWRIVFEHYFPKESFRFITYSKSHYGNATTGSGQCLSYKDYLSKEFFICIDSDYKYIYRESDINIFHFIFQTYTYSFENHLCFSDGLSEVCKASTGFENNYYDFNRFFMKFSGIVYELFVWHIMLYKKNVKFFSIKEFWDTITFKKNRNDIRNQSEKYLNILKVKVRNKIRKLERLNPSVNIEEGKLYLRSLGILENNVYLFLRGHNMYSLCVSIGRDVCEWILNEEKQKFGGDSLKITQLYHERKTFKENLKNNIQFDQYPEISNIDKDIKYYKFLLSS